MDFTPSFSKDGLIHAFAKDELNILEYENRDALGRSAALAVAELMRRAISVNGMVRIVFASAMSQTDFLKYLAFEPNIDWTRVFAFHLDDYKDFPNDHEQSFSRFLIDRLFSKVEGAHFHPIDSEASDADAELRRYAKLLTEAPIDIMILGIGESGHLAFIDPEYCDFDDPSTFKITTMDQQTRDQLIHDGCFRRIEDVPTTAYSMTIPACLSGSCTVVIVPTALKAKAIKAVIEGPVTTKMPASVLKTKTNAWLLIDKDSGQFLRSQ